MNLYLIRHTSVNVPKGVCYGQTDVGLRQTFSDEAAIVRQQIEQIKFDLVYTSPLSRCVRLADFCGFSEAGRDERLREMFFGDWEMQAWDKIEDEHLQRWFQDWERVPALNGESLQDLYQRFCDFLAELPHMAENVAIFTHGGIINCARVYAQLTTFEEMFEEVPAYGSVTRIVYLPD